MENNLSIVKDKFKELPNNIEAEQAILGSLLVSNEIYDEISPFIKSNNFSILFNGSAFKYFKK